MQSYKWFKRLLLAVGICSFSPLASAYIQYDYSTGLLDWKLDKGQSNIHQQLTDLDKVSFDFSIKIDETKLSSTSSTLVTITEADVTPKFSGGYDQGIYEFKPKVRGRVEINPDRTMKYWYLLFDLKVNDLTLTAEQNKSINKELNLGSFGGANTCNCDLLQEQYYNRVLAHTAWGKNAAKRYGNRSDFDNWTITAKVPEGNGFMLAAIGLLGLFMIRRSARLQR